MIRPRVWPPLPASMYSVIGPIPVEMIPNLRASDGEAVHGLWLEGERVIRINASDSRETQWLTLWHEWTHATLWHGGVTLPSKSEERVCDAMAAAIVAMLFATD